MQDFKKGPFQMKDGKPTDAEIFKEELSQESEDRTDKIFYLRALNKKAKEIKASREMKESVSTLMEGFKEFE